MRPDQIKDEISRLELSEKLLLVEDIWDAIAADNSEIPLPEWQNQELKKRYEEYKEGKLELHDWKSVFSTLQGLFGETISIHRVVFSRRKGNCSAFGF